MKAVILLAILMAVSAQNSPNGKEYLSTLSQDDLEDIPSDVLEDINLDVPGLINKYGYGAETHNVLTEDGYMVTMHRILGKNRNVKKIPVLLMHGLTGSSADWILNGPEKGFGYILSNEGYDVWLGNARGNFYSKNHVYRDPKGRPFWMFSWNEIGLYDLPEMIEYILDMTDNEKLHYVGHGQGTTAFFVMASSRPEYNNFVISMQAFSPVAFMEHTEDQRILQLGEYASSTQMLLTLIGQNEFSYKSKFMTELVQEYCQVQSEYMPMCLNLLYGKDNFDQLNSTMIPVYVSHAPAGASSRQFAHYAQIYVSKKFCQYDFGSFGNLATYQQVTPPSYKLKQVTAPVALHFSDSDYQATEKDVTRLCHEISNPIDMFKVPLSTFGHLDFVWGIDAKSLLYDRTLEIMRSFEK